MGSLASCMKKAGKALSAEDKNAIIDAARGHRESGKSASDAAKLAVDERIAHVNALLVEAGKPKPAAKSVRAVPETPTPSANTIFTEDAAAAARARLKAKLGRLQSGIDPETLMDGITLAGYHIEKGARTFAAYARAMLDDLGDGVKPYLKSWYMGVKYDPRAAAFEGMDDAAKVDAADLEKLTAVAEPTPEADNSAHVPQPNRTAADDRGGDAGARPVDVRAPEGGRDAGASGGGARGRSAPELSGHDVAEAGVGTTATSGNAVHGGRGGTDSHQKRSGGSRDSASAGVPKRVFNAAPGSLTRSGSWRETARRNLDVIELVKRLEKEGRAATPAEQAEIAKFTGWGASEIAQGLFPLYDYQAKPEWKDLIARRDALMSPDELATAKRSTQNAHYTSETVTRAMWDAVRAMGFEGGRIVEPGMGIGLFPLTAPADVMAKSSYTGIEMDHMTAQIAKQLVQGENVIENDYAKVPLPHNFFDLAIGNPPFANIKIISDPEYAKKGFLLHDYFFAKTMDRLRPGGIMAFVTSNGTMDKNNQNARAYMAERADLIGAIRLPNNAFQQNAGTEVVTDILFFRKREPGQQPAGAHFLKLDEVKTAQGTPFLINEYFAAHPEMVLGEHSEAGKMYRAGAYTVAPNGENLETQLKAAIATLPKGIFAPKSDSLVRTQAAIERDFNPKSKKEGTLYVADDGNLMVVRSGVGTGLTAKLSPAQAKFLRGYVGLRDALKTAQYDQLNDGDWEKSLRALNKAYTAFVKEHGNILAHTRIERTTKDEETGEEKTYTYNRYKNEALLRLDIDSALVEQLEKINDEDGSIQPGRFLTGRSLQKPKAPEINSLQDALMVTLDERGRLDLPRVAELAKRSVEDVIAELDDAIFQTPAGEYQMADEYLSGDVASKLEDAEAAAKTDHRFDRNVAALVKVQPKPLSPADINVNIGAGWIPMKVYEAFADEVLEQAITINHVNATNSWKLEPAKKTSRNVARAQVSNFGTPDRSALEVFTAALQGTGIKVTRTEKVNGSTKTYTDAEATAAANEKLKAMQQEFSRWVWQDAQRGQEISALYNRRFNNIAPRSFDGKHLTLPGLSLKYNLHPHQKRAIWRIVQTGNTYLAHAVGAGKTLEMVVAGMEMRRLGLVRKPMYAVPKHMLKQFAAEFLDAYPAANVMVADDKNFDPDKRADFIAQATMNDPDAIIITHPAFTRLSVRDESKQAVAKRFIADLEAAISEEDDKFRRKEMEAQLERLEQRFQSKANKTGTDKLVDFEEMGVDMLFVDEAHEFRKLDFVSRRGNLKGIDPNGSARALDLFIKAQHLESKNPGRSLVLASGTPIVNTLGELYSVQRFLDIGQLEKDGLDHFDVWANQFGQVQRILEQNAAGGYEFVERFASFVNVPELMSRVRSKMDILTSSQLGNLVKRPKLIGGQPNLVVTPMSDRLEAYLRGELATRIEISRKWKPSRDEPHNTDPLINIITDGRLAAIDMRFVDPSMKDDPESKLNRMLDDIVAKFKATRSLTYSDKDTGKVDVIKGATQIVFSAVGFGEQVGKNRGFDIKAAIIQKLTAGGMRRDQIAFMDEYPTDAKKAQMFKDMRAGRIAVLFGSPKNMGTGVNVQKRLKHLHYLSPPWYPADVEQPHGRIERQGNQNEEAGINWYATKGTYDSTMWQMNARKARFIEQAFTGDSTVRKLEDVSEASQYEMASALSSGDQRAIQLAGLNSDVERLARLQGAHSREQSEFRSRLRMAESRIVRTEKMIALYDAVWKQAEPLQWEPLRATIGDRADFKKPSDIGQAAIEAMQQQMSAWKPETDEQRVAGHAAEIGKLYGKFPLTVDVGMLGGVKYAGLDVKFGEGVEYDIESKVADPTTLDATGLAQRMRNKVGAVGMKLTEMRSEVQASKNEIKQLQSRIGVPFSFEQELFEKKAEASRLQAELAAANATKEETKAEGTQRAGTATAFDQLIYDQIGQGGTAQQTLQAIMKASKSRFNRQVARALLQAGVTSTLQHGTADGLKFSVKNRSNNSFAAAYKPKTDTVMLFTAAAAERNVLHELMHAATYKAIRSKGMAAGQMRVLFRHVKKSGKLAGMYGMENVDEFVAEAFSNPKFQAKLREVSAANLSGVSLKSAYDWFVRIVRRILNLGAADENALSQAISVGVRLMEQQAGMRAKTEGMATKDVVGNQSGAPADDSMGGVGRDARAAISAPSEREGYGFAPTGGMQERAVRAEKSGSPEPAQKSKAAASEAKRTPITARMEADAIAVANKEIARQSEYDVQQELESIQQNGRGYDVEKLITESPKYWDAENEELTAEGYAELDRRNEQIARNNIGIREATSLADLDYVHQFAQADAFESLAQDLGASVHGNRSFSTSRYFEVTRADGKTAGFRFADHLNTSSQHNAPDFNVAPGGNTFKQAIDWLNESPTPDNSGVDDVLGNIAEDAPPAVQAVRQRVNDVFATKKTFNWWNNTVGTQYEKAEKDADFKRVFDATQNYIGDVSKIANAAADLAPSLLPKLDSLRDLLKRDVPQADRDAIAKPIYQGTLTDQRVYTDAELRSQFGLTDKQVGLYREFRAAIDKSLDDLAKTDMLRYVGKDARAVRSRVMQASSADAAADVIAQHLEAIGKPQDGDAVRAKAMRVETLKQQGYAPLMRFGRYAVYTTDKAGGTIAFTLHESEREATKAAREMREQNPDATVTQSVMSEEAYKLYAGMEPETLELFAEMSGVEETPAFQEYLKLTKSNRDAMKRLIKRNGVAGFDQDAIRTLAAFITSNARAASKNLHYGDMTQAAADIPKEKGDVLDEAVKLIRYVQNPQDEAQAIRGLLFVNYIGGSVASAMVNMTQPLTMTYPYLAQFGAGAAAKELGRAMRMAVGKTIADPDLAKALRQAEADGVVSPQEIFQLQGAAGGGNALARNLRWLGVNDVVAEKAGSYADKGLHIWGSMFSLAEQFNRRATFIAAYNMAKAQGNADPFAFAEKAVQETQGVYNRGNRPNWARGAIGATVFTFKQFSISYLEFLKRLPNREKGIALGILLLTAGIQGLPGADDLDDVIDTLGQQLGYDTNAKLWKTQALTAALGRDAAEFVMRGASAIPGMPIDVAGRMSLGNMIPGTGMLLKSKQNKTDEVFEVLGPAGGLAKDALGGKFAPTAIRNLDKALDMYQTGMYRDDKGRRVIDVDGYDALVKAIGFQPAEVARESRTSQLAQQQIAVVRTAEADIAQKWAEGIFENKPEKVVEAAEALRRWNIKNPNSMIAIQPNQIKRRVLEMMMEKEDRIIKRAPKEVRWQIAELYAQ